MNNYKVMASNSIMFYESAKLLKSAFDAAIEAKNKELTAYYFAPYIVNKSFAVEMAIKAVLMKKSVSYNRIHKLDELFQCLSSDWQAQVINGLKMVFKLSDSNCNDELIKIGNAFVDWRYFHEKSNSINVAFFNSFAEIICQLCYNECKTKEQST